jgi:ectoine hydroxylase-related dioxygenase (phytanoyl-CoA dioxygenase family)
VTLSRGIDSLRQRLGVGRSCAPELAGLEPPLPTPRGRDPHRDPSEIPSFASRFGGLWTDLTNAKELALGKLELGFIDESEHRALEFWIDHGYVVLRGAVSDELIAALNRDIESVWKNGHTSAWINAIEGGRGVTRPLEASDHEKVDGIVKLIDIYDYLESARRVMFAPAIVRFLDLVFERPSMAHQSLSFYRGSKQPFHQDTAFVRVSSPLELAASWVALEDVSEGSGELQYYPGSHRFDEFLFEGKHKWFPPGNQELGHYYEQLDAQAQERGIEAQTFLPRRGDALIWSADFAHGGSNYSDSSKTRRSLVTHYCPANVYPMYYHYGRYRGPIRWGKRSRYCSAEKVLWQAGR